MGWLDVILTVMFCHCCDNHCFQTLSPMAGQIVGEGPLRCVMIVGMAFCYDVGVMSMIYGVE
jgi:hypothetical protein